MPDVLLEPDTLTMAEQLFSRELDGKLTAFRDVLTGYALDLRRGGLGSEALRGGPGDAASRFDGAWRLGGFSMADSVFAGRDEDHRRSSWATR